MKQLPKPLSNREAFITVSALLTLMTAVLTAAYMAGMRTVQSAHLDEYNNAPGTTVYAAPKPIRRGQTLEREKVVEHLRRIGYSEAPGDEPGTYRFEGRYELHINARNSDFGYRMVNLTFHKNHVASIRTDAGETDSIELEPEMLGGFFTLTKDEKSYPMRIERVLVTQQEVVQSKYYRCLLAAEDEAFDSENGIAWRGLARVFIKGGEGGASGLTQQLAKNAYLRDQTHSYLRKLKEAFVALNIERKFSKPEIAALHSNTSSFGQVRGGPVLMGVGAAARELFGVTSLEELSLAQSCTLASMHKSPGEFMLAAQSNDYVQLTTRRNAVLDNVRANFPAEFSAEQIELAKAEPIAFKFLSKTKQHEGDSVSRYFEEYAASKVESLTGLAANVADLRVYTTVEMELQRAGYAAVAKHLATLDETLAARGVKPGTINAALVAMNVQTGEIVSMIGGRDYQKSQFNRASDAMRQPGSVFKPFVYSAALNTAFDPAARRVITSETTFMDAPKTFRFGGQTYSPDNFGNKYSYRPVTLHDALVHSLNVVTVDIATEVGMGKIMDLAERSGLPRPSHVYPAMALGTSEATPLQIAEAYTVFAADGTRVEPTAFRKVIGGDGRVVAASLGGQRTGVIRPGIAHTMTSFMKDVVNRGTAASLRARGFKFNVAGKTGTSRDGWFVGYTPHIVCVVYVGFDDGSQLGLTGAQSALPIWADFMMAALSLHPEWQ